MRVTHLAETLARCCFETHLLFVGDPTAPGSETQFNGRYTLHRWCQWISLHYPLGVYAGEEEKLGDFNNSVSPFVIQKIIQPALVNGRLPVILAEEWHTAEAIIRLHYQLQAMGLRQHCMLYQRPTCTICNFTCHKRCYGRFMPQRMQSWPTAGTNPLAWLVLRMAYEGNGEFGEDFDLYFSPH